MIKFTISEGGTKFKFTEEPVELDYHDRSLAGIFLARAVLQFVNGDNEHDHVLRGLAHRILYREPARLRELRKLNELVCALREAVDGHGPHLILRTLDRVDAAINKLDQDQPE